MGEILKSDPAYRAAYGVYTVGDSNFFSGIVAAINSLRYHGYGGPVAVADVGFYPWMAEYLAGYDDVSVLDMDYLRRTIRFTDVRDTDQRPVMHGWAFKAFAIAHFNLFETFTFIDADYLPLCNLEEELRPLAEAGQFVSTEDGVNNWDERHQEAIGLRPDSHVNINSGFFTLSMRHFDWLVFEWRDLMTRRRPFDLWYIDQGALNAILDKYEVEKTAFDRLLWNQTWMNESLGQDGHVRFDKQPAARLVHTPTNQPFKGWHGWGSHKPWHCLGIDEYRKDSTEREQFHAECNTKMPAPVVDCFAHFLFMDRYNRALKRDGHRIVLG